MRCALAGTALKFAGAPHVFELDLQLGDAVAQEAAVGLDLAFAGAAQKAEAAALPLQVRPRPHEAGAFVFEAGHLDLQPPLAGPGAAAEDLQDQPGAVDDLGGPGLLQVALLHGPECVVHHHHVDVARLADFGDLIDTPGAEEGRWRRAAQRREQRLLDPEIERFRQPDRLRQARFIAPRAGPPSAYGMDHERGLYGRRAIDGRLQSASSSNSGS